ncbi:MAG: hypothetical protein KKA42_04475 [candidate division Zixibacteria bacterium]|nr:hypothetical protein [candidate division Zixibacteria bacterium]
MSDFKLQSVNWQDGMLLSMKHLRDQERFFEELARWHAVSAGNRFGLVRRSAAAEPALMLSSSLSGNVLRVEVVRCQALTPGGHYIEIGSSGNESIMAEAEITAETVPVYLSVDPDAKRVCGDADPSEDVPRMPYLCGSYQLHLGSEPSMPMGRVLQIAELRAAGGDIAHAKHYFPPCLTLDADERLGQQATDLRNRLENLLSLASRAYAAITTAGALSQESSSVQVAFKETMYTMAYHLSATLDEFVVGRNSGHPIDFVIGFKKMLRVFSTLLNLHPGLKDYLNARFFIKQLNSEVAHFLASIDSFLLAEYNHRDIGGQLRMIGDTMGIMREIFGFLAQLKREQLGPQAVASDTLTYAGKSYRAVTCSGHAVSQVGELSYLTIDFASPSPVADTVALLSKELFTIPEWNNMQVRLGINEARGLGETDPVDVDVTSYGDKVALHPQDMLKSQAVRQVTFIFRGARDTGKLVAMDSSDLVLYSA